MKTNVVDSIDGLTVDQTFDPESTNLNVTTVASQDVSGVPVKRRRARQTIKLFKYVLGDVYRLCYASDRNEAMLVFGAVDHVRVDAVVLGDQFIYDLFSEGCVIQSLYDGRNIFQIPFK